MAVTPQNLTVSGGVFVSYDRLNKLLYINLQNLNGQDTCTNNSKVIGNISLH